MLSTFTDKLNVDSIRVYPPKKGILLCGGVVSSIVDPHPISMRDAFLRGGWDGAKNLDLLMIEDIIEFFEKDSPYDDLVEFEKDIAQICELVLLFPESPGSFAELGSFSMFREIREKILVVIRNKYLGMASFIAKGPVASLRKDFPNSVFSLIDRRIGLEGDDFSKIDCALLVEKLDEPIRTRLGESSGRTTLDTEKFGHLCKVYCGLLNEFYALYDEEIINLLKIIGFTLTGSVLSRVAFCCSALRWTSNGMVGFDRVHFALPGNEAAKFDLEPPLSDKMRRRAEIRQHWEQADPDRVAAVDERLAR